MQPLVSIIIPTFNRSHLIGKTLDSVLNQTYPNWECIVVDDDSTDYTPELLDFYCQRGSRIKYTLRPENRPKGANSCRNYGFEISQGEFIIWFDSDDYMLEKHLETQINVFKDKVNLIICSGFYTDEFLRNRIRMKMDEKMSLFKSFVLWESHIFTSSVLFRKSFLEEKALFSTEISRGQEAELFSRLFFKLPETSYQILNTPVFLYRQHSSSVSFEDNRGYVKRHKASRSYIAIENLKRSISIRDNELVEYYYRALINLFFLGLENNHKTNSNYILDSLITLLTPHNRRKGMILFLLGRISLVVNRRSYRIEKYLHNLDFGI